jgi:hypothetical protein
MPEGFEDISLDNFFPQASWEEAGSWEARFIGYSQFSLKPFSLKIVLGGEDGVTMRDLDPAESMGAGLGPCGVLE